MQNIQIDIQKISDYLAHRSCDEEHITNVDIIVMTGNSMPSIAQYASTLYKKRIAPRILVCGGIGHSTKLLYENMELLGYNNKESWNGKSEAQCLAYVLEANGVEKKDIIIEMKSTNTGENASYAKEVLMQLKKPIHSMLLLQDPMLQLRTYATFQKIFPFIHICSYATFRPNIQKDGTPFIHGMNDIWDKQRFLSLLFGELQRVYDNEHGYGPNGKDYMLHVDMPKEIYDAWQRIDPYLKGTINSRR